MRALAFTSLLLTGLLLPAASPISDGGARAATHATTKKPPRPKASVAKPRKPSARKPSAKSRTKAAGAASHSGKGQAAARPFRMSQAVLEPVDYDRLPGWDLDDHAAALATFRTSCRPILAGRDPVRPGRPVFAALKPICSRAAKLPAAIDNAAARAFFEKEFRPVFISAVDSEQGFLTGYYEPEVEGSRERTDDYATPLYRRPPDLIMRAAKRGSVSNKGPAFRKVGKKLEPYYDRAAIEDGALDGRALELAWIRDPVDAFFSSIQGSVRVRLPDGHVLRLNYDGHNGQAYTPVGRILVDKGILPREKVSMDTIRAYIAENPEAGRELMRQNRSYIFFRIAREISGDDGAVGAQGLPLTAERSIAIDRNLHVYGTPFYIDATLPIDGEAATTPFRRLMVAQDTGSAIIGPARGDLFFGAGKEAGSIAGRIRHPGRFAMLLPRPLDPALAPPPPLPPERPAEAPKRAVPGAPPAVSATP